MRNMLDADYKSLISNVLTNGTYLETRGTLSKYVFGSQLVHDTRLGFPASTLTNFYPASAINEMLKFDLQSYGEVSSKFLSPGLLRVWQSYLVGNNTHITGSYCENWRAWGNIDQLDRLVKNLKSNPTSRSHVVQTYNPSTTYEQGGMPNCGVNMVFSSDGRHLDLLQTNRSIDIITGLRGDLCRYGVLLELIASLTGLTARYLQFSSANAHIYDKDFADAEAMLDLPAYNLPKFTWLEKPTSLAVADGTWALQGYNYNKSFKKSNKTIDLGDINAYSFIR